MPGPDTHPDLPDPDPQLTPHLHDSGWLHPRTDAQLDRWLEHQPWPEDQRRWTDDVVARHGPAPVGQPIGTPVQPLTDSTPSKAKPTSAAPPRPRPLSADHVVQLHATLCELVRRKSPLPAGLRAAAADLERGPLARVFQDLGQALDAGQPLSDALSAHASSLPPAYLDLLAAGEAAGDLLTPLALVHEQAATEAEFRRQLREALYYPAATCLAAAAGAVGFVVFLAERFQILWHEVGAVLPLSTRALLEVSEFAREFPALSIPLSLAALGGAVVAGRRLLPWLMLKALGLRDLDRGLSELSRCLAGFLRQGVPLPRALAAVPGALPGIPADSLHTLRARLQEGQGLGEALRGLDPFPTTYTWLVGAAERRGELPEALSDLARRHADRYRDRLHRTHSIFPVVILLAVSLIVLGGFLALYSPLFSLQRVL